LYVIFEGMNVISYEPIRLPIYITVPSYCSRWIVIGFTSVGEGILWPGGGTQSP
jgi:hypothetical protein